MKITFGKLNTHGPKIFLLFQRREKRFTTAEVLFSEQVSNFDFGDQNS